MSDLDQVVRDFQADLDRARHLLELVKSFREFGASSVPPKIVSGEVAWSEALLLHNSSRERRTDLPVFSGALLLYLAGRFEYFVRQVVQAVAEDISAKVLKYSDLPDALRGQLRALTLDVVKTPRKYGFDEVQADALLIGLTDNLKGASAPLSISSEVLSITDANMKDRVVADLMKRVGMADFWRDLGKQAQMKVHLEKRDDPDATREAQSRLNSIMDERNQIAHPTSATRFPDPDQVLVHAGFLSIFAIVTVDLARLHLATYAVLLGGRV